MSSTIKDVHNIISLRNGGLVRDFCFHFQGFGSVMKSCATLPDVLIFATVSTQGEKPLEVAANYGTISKKALVNGNTFDEAGKS